MIKYTIKEGLLGFEVSFEIGHQTFTLYECDTLESAEMLQKSLDKAFNNLLCHFFKFFRDNGEANLGMTIEQFVKEYLKQCGKEETTDTTSIK